MSAKRGDLWSLELLVTDHCFRSEVGKAFLSVLSASEILIPVNTLKGASDISCNV